MRSIGFSSRDPLDAIKIIEKYKFDFLQVGFSVYDQRLIETGLINKLKKKNIFLITRSPFNSGYLTKNNNPKLFNKKIENLIINFKKKIKKKLHMPISL